MKRGKPLARKASLGRASKPLARTKALGRANGLGRGSQSLKRGPAKRRPPIPPEATAEVVARTDGMCCCGCGRRGAHRHHVYPVQRWPELVADPRNMVWVAEGCHDAHERARRRLPRSAVACAEPLAATPAMEDYLTRTYGPKPDRAGADPGTDERNDP